MSEIFTAGKYNGISYKYNIKLIPGALLSGLILQFEKHGLRHGTLHGTIHWKSEKECCGCSLALWLNQDFSRNLNNILKVLLGEEKYMSATYSSNTKLDKILVEGLDATAVIVNGRICGFAHEGRFALTFCEKVLESKEELIEFLNSYKE